MVREPPSAVHRDPTVFFDQLIAERSVLGSPQLDEPGFDRGLGFLGGPLFATGVPIVSH